MDEVFAAAPAFLQLPDASGSARGVREAVISPPSAPGTLSSLLPPPAYAEHTRQILSEVADMDPAEIEALLQAGVAEQA